MIVLALPSVCSLDVSWSISEIAAALQLLQRRSSAFNAQHSQSSAEKSNQGKLSAKFKTPRRSLSVGAVGRAPLKQTENQLVHSEGSITSPECVPSAPEIGHDLAQVYKCVALH